MVMRGNEALRVHLGMALVQATNGGYHVLTKSLLNVGMSEVAFYVYRDFVAISILALQRCRFPFLFPFFKEKEKESLSSLI